MKRVVAGRTPFDEFDLLATHSFQPTLDEKYNLRADSIVEPRNLGDYAGKHSGSFPKVRAWWRRLAALTAIRPRDSEWAYDCEAGETNLECAFH
jgi:hypothetical protein